MIRFYSEIVYKCSEVIILLMKMLMYVVKIFRQYFKGIRRKDEFDKKSLSLCIRPWLGLRILYYTVLYNNTLNNILHLSLIFIPE
jgi:hypothetical protein